MISFDEAVTLAKSRTDCHPDNIDTLVRIVKETRDIPGDIAECGSYKCGATIAMASAAPSWKRVYAFDLFGGLPYRSVGFENFQDADFKEILDVTSSFKNIVLLKGPHEVVVPQFSRYRYFPLSLIFMDSDHYESHKVCLTHLWPMLSPGGMVVFHDWSFEGVQAAINRVLGSVENVNHLYPESANMGFIVKK